MIGLFPTSYPYLNNHSVEITEEEVNNTMRSMLQSNKTNSLYGLEIAYAVVCAMSHVRESESLLPLSFRIFETIRKRVLIKEYQRRDKKKEVSLESLSFAASEIDDPLRALDLEKLISKSELEALSSMSRQSRWRALKSIQKKAEELGLC